jgi:hypothetical protein
LQSIDENGGRFDDFVKRIKILKEHGFIVLVSYVAAPDRLKKLRTFKHFFEDNGIPFVVNIFSGLWHDGRVYPDAYSPDETALLDDTINCEVRRYSLERHSLPCVYGKLCDHGHTRIDIQADSGNIKGCFFDANVIGNIYTGQLSLRSGPRYCQYKHCSVGSIPYDIATTEFRYSTRRSLWTVKEHYDTKYYEELKHVIANPCYDGINLTPLTTGEKHTTLVQLESAEAANAMFFDSYILQGNLYKDLHKLSKARKSYRKALINRDRETDNDLIKKLRFLSLPVPARKCVSLLRRILGKVNAYYGYA